jgi:hypothetical protein
MTRRLAALLPLLALTALPATAQPLPMGVFSWQLAPYCNVLSLTTSQDGAVYTFDGTDNQCGASTLGTVRGLAVINPNGTVGIGLTIVSTPGGLPVHVQATIDQGTLGGPWTDDHGNSGTFVFGPTAASGSPRPLASAAIPTGVVTSAKIADGTVAAVDVNAAEVQKRVSGACATGELMTGVNEDGSVVCTAVSSGSGGDITGVTAGVGMLGGGTTGTVTLNVNPNLVQARVTGVCAGGESISAIAANGTVTCEVDDVGTGDITSVTAGSGLLGGGSTGAVTLSANFGGSGSANTAARSDHTHERVTSSNIAIGLGAGASITSGSGSTAVGASALADATGFTRNTAIGWNALQHTTTSQSTAVGAQALADNVTGGSNTAVGDQALRVNVAGSQNVAVGSSALNASTGSRNLALGFVALGNMTSGDDNIAIGDNAGANVTTGSGNIYIGSPGAAEGGTIRIGHTGQTRTFLRGVNGVTTAINNAVPVVVDSAGQLGTVSSSAKTKFDIQDLPADVTSAVARLRPVSFRYKQPFADGSTPVQYGLIAEEVQQVLPELIAYDDQGEPATVKYHVLPSLLLAEVQRLQAALQVESARTTALAAAVAELRATLAARER